MQCSGAMGRRAVCSLRGTVVGGEKVSGDGRAAEGKSAL